MKIVYNRLFIKKIFVLKWNKKNYLNLKVENKENIIEANKKALKQLGKQLILIGYLKPTYNIFYQTNIILNNNSFELSIYNNVKKIKKGKFKIFEFFSKDIIKKSFPDFVNLKINKHIFYLDGSTEGLIHLGKIFIALAISKKNEFYINEKFLLNRYIGDAKYHEIHLHIKKI